MAATFWSNDPYARPNGYIPQDRTRPIDITLPIDRNPSQMIPGSPYIPAPQPTPILRPQPYYAWRATPERSSPPPVFPYSPPVPSWDRDWDSDRDAVPKSWKQTWSDHSDDTEDDEPVIPYPIPHFSRRPDAPTRTHAVDRRPHRHRHPYPTTTTTATQHRPRHVRLLSPSLSSSSSSESSVSSNSTDVESDISSDTLVDNDETPVLSRRRPISLPHTPGVDPSVLVVLPSPWPASRRSPSRSRTASACSSIRNTLRRAFGTKPSPGMSSNGTPVYGYDQSGAVIVLPASTAPTPRIAASPPLNPSPTEPRSPIPAQAEAQPQAPHAADPTLPRADEWMSPWALTPFTALVDIPEDLIATNATTPISSSNLAPAVTFTYSHSQSSTSNPGPSTQTQTQTRTETAVGFVWATSPRQYRTFLSLGQYISALKCLHFDDLCGFEIVMACVEGSLDEVNEIMMRRRREMSWDVGGEGEDRAERVRRMARWSGGFRELLGRGMRAKVAGAWWRDERQRMAMGHGQEAHRGRDGLFVAGSLKHLLRETGDRELMIPPEMDQQDGQSGERDVRDVYIDLVLVAEVLMEVRREVMIRPSSPEAMPEHADGRRRTQRQEGAARGRRDTTRGPTQDRPWRRERLERMRSPRLQRPARTEH